MTTRFQIACDVRAPATARRYVRDAIESHLPVAACSERVADVELLVSELVSNAVLHGRCRLTEFSVSATPPASLRVGVRDPGHGGAVEQRTPDLEGSGGVGLHLVERLATRWGHQLDPDGRLVWFDIDL